AWPHRRQTATLRTTAATMMPTVTTRSPTGLTALPCLDEQVADLLHGERQPFGTRCVALPVDGVAELPELVVAVRGETGERAQPVHFGEEEAHVLAGVSEHQHRVRRELAHLGVQVLPRRRGSCVVGRLGDGHAEGVYPPLAVAAAVLGSAVAGVAFGLVRPFQGFGVPLSDLGETVGGKRLRHRRPRPVRSALPRGTAPAGGCGSRGRDRPTPGG